MTDLWEERRARLSCQQRRPSVALFEPPRTCNLLFFALYLFVLSLFRFFVSHHCSLWAARDADVISRYSSRPPDERKRGGRFVLLPLPRGVASNVFHFFRGGSHRPVLSRHMRSLFATKASLVLHQAAGIDGGYRLRDTAAAAGIDRSRILSFFPSRGFLAGREISPISEEKELGL